MAHQALARKYRPATFDEMVGQQAVVRTLMNALATGKIHPAYIFSGIRGVGKTTAARLFAKGLNCAQGPTPAPCNACPSCLEIGTAGSMDVLEIDGATNTKAEEARDLMQAARYTPARDRYRVFIIDEVHMLSTAAFNALLKTFEEPPAHAVFLLATTEPHKIPETIHSRAQHFQFRRVPAHLVTQFLKAVCVKEGIEAEAAALDLVARSGEGSVRDSLTLLDRLLAYADGPISEAVAVEVLGVVGRESLLALVQLLQEGRAEAVPPFVDGLLERGQNLERLLEHLGELVRDMVRCRMAPGAGADPAVRALAEGYSQEDLLRLWDLVATTQQRLKGAPDPASLLELQLVKAALLPRILPLDQILAAAGPAAGAMAPAPGPASPPPEGSAGPGELDPAGSAGQETEGLRFTALIPFRRMDAEEASSFETRDVRAERFRALVAARVPLAGPTLEKAGLSLDPEGVLHIALPGAATTGAALLSSTDRKRVLEESAREAGFPGPVVLESAPPAAEPAAPRNPSATSPAPQEAPQGVQNVLRMLGGQVLKVTSLSEPPPPGGPHGESE